MTLLPIDPEEWFIHKNKMVLRVYLCAVMIFFASSCFATDVLDENNLNENGIENEIDEQRRIELDSFFDINKISEISLSFSLDEWNALLSYYDEDKYNNCYVKCKLIVGTADNVITIDSAGVRIRGDWSRKRPEGVTGQFHITDQTDWHHCSFAVNLNKFYDGNERTIGGVKKFDLKYFNIDPSYVREPYCYDLFRRFGIATSIRTCYCKVNVYVEGDTQPAYYGVYMLMEHIDKEYLKDRIDVFGDSKGNLWKCNVGSLTETSDDLFFVDDNSSELHNYELKTNKKNFEDAKIEIIDFIREFQEKKGDDFHDWIKTRCDVELLLRTYAVNVAVGNWDDYWISKHNYYVYFNKDSKFFFIPFDMDNSLGICVEKEKASNIPLSNPFEYGIEECNLISKIIQYSDYRMIYKNALLELINPQFPYLFYESSVSRILTWQQLIFLYVPNDTKENNNVRDQTLGIHDEYKLIEDSENNYFKIRCSVIDNYCSIDSISTSITKTDSFVPIKNNTECYSISGAIIEKPANGFYINSGKKYYNRNR